MPTEGSDVLDDASDAVINTPPLPVSRLHQKTTEASSHPRIKSMTADDLELDTAPEPIIQSPDAATAGTLTLPTVLAFIQQEWRRHGKLQSDWMVERQQWQQKVETLEASLNAALTVRDELVRRVRMLEYALLEERNGKKEENATATQITPEMLAQVWTTMPLRMPAGGKTSSVIASTVANETSNNASNIANNLISDSRDIGISTSVPAANPPTTSTSPLKVRIKVRPIPTTSTAVTTSTDRPPSPTHNAQPISEMFSASQRNTVVLPKDWFAQQLEQQKDQATTEVESVPSKETTLSGVASNDTALIDEVAAMNLGSVPAPALDEAQRKQVNNASHTWRLKFTLRSHLDAIRRLAPVRSASSTALKALLTASEDGTIKCWPLQKNRKKSVPDGEPTRVLRGHAGAIHALSCIPAGEETWRVASGGVDATVRLWQLHDLEKSPYSPFDPSVAQQSLIGHTDIISDVLWWNQETLLSAAADSSVRVWRDKDASFQLHEVYRSPVPAAVPTSLVLVSSTQWAVSYNDARVNIVDASTLQTVTRLGDAVTDGSSQIHQIVFDSLRQCIWSAHEDGQIKAFDIRSQQMTVNWLAHRDAVSCLDVQTGDAASLLVTGSHDGSVRVWDIAQRVSVQGWQAHRRKWDEAVHAVAIWSGGGANNQDLIASAGADSLAKVYV